MADSYKISLGIDFTGDKELNNIKKQLTNLTDNTHRVRIDIDNSRLLKQIEHAKKELKELSSAKGSQPSFTINSKALEDSLGRLENLIEGIKLSLGSLDNNVNTKDLVSSINQMATALGKAESESDSLVKSLSALSKKDFNFNFNFKAGNTNPVKAMTDYGREARKNSIPALEEQVAYLQKLFGGWEKADAELKKYLLKSKQLKGLNEYTRIQDDMGNASSLSKQMDALQDYIKYTKKIASEKGIDLSGFNAEFSKSAKDIVDDTIKIQTGAKQTEEELDKLENKLKNVFGGGIDAESLSISLTPIIEDLREIREAIQELSKGFSLGGLTQSFDRLSGSIENLLVNAEKVKGVLGSVDVGKIDANIGTAKKNTIQTRKNNSDSEIDGFLKEFNLTGENAKIVRDKFASLTEAMSHGINSDAYEESLADLINTVKKLGTVSKQADDDMESILNTLQGYHLDVSGDYYKQEFGDDWKSVRNRNQAILANKNSRTKVPVDVAYEELSEAYPLYFPKDIWNPADQLRKIFEVHDDARYGSKNRKVDVSEIYSDSDLRDWTSDIVGGIQEQIEAEQQLAQVSTETTRTVVQNENSQKQALEDALARKKQRLEEINREYDALGNRHTEVLENENLSYDEKDSEIFSISLELDKLEEEENLIKTQIKSIEESLESEARKARETANVVTQNEERKQQEAQETADKYENVARQIQQSGKLISNSAQNAINNVGSKSIDRAFRVSEDDSLKFKQEMENLISQWTNGKGELTDIKINTSSFFDGDTGRNIEQITSAIVTYNNELGETIKKTIALRQIDTKQTGEKYDKKLNKNVPVYEPVVGFVEVAGQYSKSLGKTKVQTDAFVKQQKQAVSNLTNQINQLNRAANDQNASRPIKDSSNLDALKSKYNEITSAIQRMGNATTDTFSDEQNNVRTLISEYKSLVSEFKNAENVSSKMKGTDFTSGLDIAKENYKKFLADAKGFSVDTSKLNIDTVTDTASLNKFTDALRVAKAELGKLKAEVSSAKRSTDSTNRAEALGIDVNDLRRNIEGLRKLSPEIDGFKTVINGAEVTVDSLLNGLSDINVQSDFRVARKNFESFTKAAEEAGIAITKAQKESINKKVSDEETKRINSAYKDIYDTRKKIGSLEVDLIGAEAKGDAQSIKDINDEITRLKSNLASLDKDNIGFKFTDEQKSSLRELRKQNQYNKKQAQNSVDYKTGIQIAKDEAQVAKAETKAINDTYNEIYNLKKKIGSLEVDLIKAEDTKDAQSLKSEIERLKDSLSAFDKDGISSKFTEKQKNSLKELEYQNKLAKNLAENKVEAKIESQTSKDDAKELEESFKELKRLATEMGKIDIELVGLTDVENDIDKFNSLKRVAEELEVEFQVLRESINLNPNQIRELDQIFVNTTGAVRELNNEMAKSDETSELTSGLDRLKTIAKEINALKLDIFKFEDADNIQQATNRLNELEIKAVELRATLQQKYNITSFDEIDNIARQGEEALNSLIAKAEEAKTKLAKSIKLDIELGNFDNEIDEMYAKFDRLSDANDDLRFAYEHTKLAYEDMLNAAEANTGDEVADRERLIQAEKQYAAALEKTNNLIKQQARADKIANDAEKLADKKTALKLDMANYLKNNSRAAKEFGDEIRRLSSLLDNVNLDDVGVNKISRTFKNLTKEIKNAGKDGLTVFDRLKSKAKEYITYLSAAEVFMWIEQGMREMFNTVKEIDTAMTGLYRVTDLTASQYDVLFDNMIDSAKEYGATLNDIINATTDWVRAGFEADTALGLAEVTTMYQHISDLDYDTAAENLITAYNGFKDELNGAFNGDQVAAVNYIADIFNELDKQNCPLVV